MKMLKSLVLSAFMAGSANAEIVSLDSLIVNNNDNIQTVVCVPENIADIQARQLLTSEYEEGWIFDKSCWHEILRETSKIDYTTNENGEYAFGYVYPGELDSLFFSAEDTLKFRHTHPFGNVDEYRELFASFEWSDWEQAWIDLKVDGAIPSDVDVELLIWMQNQYKDVLKEGILIGQISSEFGITDFYLTPKGREHFYVETDEKISDFAHEKWIDYIQTEVPYSDNIIEWIQDYASSMNNIYFEVKFKPYQNLDPEILSLEWLFEREKEIYYKTYE